MAVALPRDRVFAHSLSGGTNANTVAAAKQAERLGYTRFWVAEHHGVSDHLAGTTPEVLLGHLAAETDDIRLGSGAVLLNHYSPFKIAELFGTLDGLAPGRIDAGFGRANGSPTADRALGSSPSSAAIAGELGLPYCFAAFIRPGFATRAFETYRDRFRPSPTASASTR